MANNKDHASLWKDFQTCAESTVQLHRDPSWQCFKMAAKNTTLFYKNAVKYYEESYSLGIDDGRFKLAKDLCEHIRQNPDISLASVMKVLNTVMDGNQIEDLPEELSPRSSLENNGCISPVEEGNDPKSIHLFQEALATSESTELQENLNEFLTDEVKRHRKRGRADSSSFQNKRQRV